MFKSKTVESIMATFTKTISDLEEVMNERQKEIDTNTKIIQTLEATNGENQQEIDNAASISVKLKSLLS
ncbi:MAG TPA: hypothetical protein VFQ47_08980 [Nitrososphaera sp.]|jgi:hypothetical protein|nr:hypothetical protein [Nitrososphaera sp.]